MLCRSEKVPNSVCGSYSIIFPEIGLFLAQDAFSYDAYYLSVPGLYVPARIFLKFPRFRFSRPPAALLIFDA